MSNSEPVDAIAPLTALAEEMGIPLSKMRRWADADRNNNFPEVIDRIGPVKFYRRVEVERWVRLYDMTNYSKARYTDASQASSQEEV